MRVRNFLIPLFLIVLISFVIAQTCSNPGYYNGTHYCGLDGQVTELKADNESCENAFECRNQSCNDGLCQEKFVAVDFPNQTNFLIEIWNLIQGIECDPANQTYHCKANDTHAYLCGSNAVYEDKGEIPGVCGVPLFTCPNGVVEAPYEECDDNNTYSNDSCKGDCTFNLCGDNSTYIGVEECDDGNNVSGDGCNDACILETCPVINSTNCSGFYSQVCNDSYLWEIQNLTLGECGVECLPVGNVTCNFTETLECNGSYVWENIGNVSGSCGFPLWDCGNGTVEAPYEECDDNNTYSNDSCKGDCTWNFCGDGSIYLGVEECDDGNNVSGDGCNTNCVIEECVTINITNCSGFYNITCNESYLWEPANLTIGECGVECLPLGNESCNGSEYLLCNSSYIWDNQGLVNGKCGHSSGGGGGGSGGGSSRSQTEIIDLLIYSPIANVTYSVDRIPLEVIDPNGRAEFWRYSLNGAKKLDFVPNTTIFAMEGHNSLIVFAREKLKDENEIAKLVEFDVELAEERDFCGNGLCGELENCDVCVSDCGECPVVETVYCGNAECDLAESSYSCPSDCIAAERTDYTYVAIGVAASSLAVLGFVLYRRFFSGASQVLDPRGE